MRTKIDRQLLDRYAGESEANRPFADAEMAAQALVLLLAMFDADHALEVFYFKQAAIGNVQKPLNEEEKALNDLWCKALNECIEAGIGEPLIRPAERNP